VPFIAVQYSGSVQASKQGYSKGSLGPFITGQYNDSVEASKQGYSKESMGNKAIVRGVCGPL
jgi:hypothetical protein